MLSKLSSLFMKQDGSSDTASLVCFVGAVVLSSFFWFYWLYGVEWVWFRGCVAAQTMFQSLGLLVLMVRDKRMVSRIIILFLIRQICSTFTDWIWRFILEPESGWYILARLMTQSWTPLDKIAVVFSSWLLLGGMQAIFIDTLWRLGRRIVSFVRLA